MVAFGKFCRAYLVFGGDQFGWGKTVEWVRRDCRGCEDTGRRDGIMNTRSRLRAVRSHGIDGQCQPGELAPGLTILPGTSVASVTRLSPGARLGHQALDAGATGGATLLQSLQWRFYCYLVPVSQRNPDGRHKSCWWKESLPAAPTSRADAGLRQQAA